MHSESTQLITFLSTSIDGDPQPSAMTSKDERIALAQHDRLLIETIEAENGELFKSVGRGIRAAFAEPANAIRAAVKGQMALQTLAKAGGASLLGKRVRMALHSGAAEKFEKLYSGAPITHLGALAEAGHGGQILVSDTTRRLASDNLPYQTTLIDLGRHGLNDYHRPVHIWQLRHSDLPEEFPALRTHNLAATNLPFHTTTFVGRKGEIARIRPLIDPGRPVTLTGEAGIGKTRLACEIGFAMLGELQDGVRLVALDSIPDASCLADELAVQLQIRRQAQMTAFESLVAYLRDKSLLLILDHCDERIAECADLVRNLRERCRNVSILATASSSLGVEGERSFQVPPLAPPPAANGTDPMPPVYDLARFESVRLFLERARSRCAEFEATPAIVASLCRVCLLVDGNALTIEIAAAQAHERPIEEMAVYIASSAAVAPIDRHTDSFLMNPLAAMVDWSYAALSVKEKILLLRLSVFEGGWEEHEAEAICSDTAEAIAADPDVGIAEAEVAPLLAALEHRALVRRRDAEPSDRFDMPKVVADFSRARRQRTREDSRIRSRHCMYFFKVAREALDAGTFAERSVLEEQFERSGHNLHVALGEAVLAVTLPAISIRPGAVERLLLFTAFAVSVGIRIGSYDSFGGYLSAALAAPGAHAAAGPRATTLLAAARKAWIDGERKNATAFVDEALEIFRDRGDSDGVARSLQLLGVFAGEGSHRIANPNSIDTDSGGRRTGSRPAEWSTADASGSLEWDGHDLLSVIQADSVRRDPRQAGHERALAAALNALGSAALDRGDLEAARSCLGESLDLWRKLKDTPQTAASLERLALLACAESKPDWAAILYVVASHLREEEDMLLSAAEREDRHHIAQSIRSQVASAKFEEAEGLYGKSSIDEALANTYGPILHMVEGGNMVVSGETTVRIANTTS